MDTFLLFTFLALIAGFILRIMLVISDIADSLWTIERLVQKIIDSKRQV